MQENPCRDGRRARQHAFKVVDFQMHAHTEHDQHQQRGDPRTNARERGGGVIREYGEQQRP